jgi:hypothetical protein
LSAAKCTIVGAEGDNYVIDATALRHGVGAESGHRLVHFAPLNAPYARFDLLVSLPPIQC